MRIGGLLLLVAAPLLKAVAIDNHQKPFLGNPDLITDPSVTEVPPTIAQENAESFQHALQPSDRLVQSQTPNENSLVDTNFLHMFGQLSHYFPNPTGFGVDEYPLPKEANVTTLFMLHRHGARYPTTGAGVKSFSEKIANNTNKFKASGALEFLNEWKDETGVDILVPMGRQELFDSGAQHYRQYGHLYPNDGKKIVARSTTQNRMTESAERFLAGFFGSEWTRNASLELIIEQVGFNNTLAGYFKCNNSFNVRSRAGTLALVDWAEIYLADATQRIQSAVEPHGFFNFMDIYNMQTMCAYEIAAFGTSAFCNLFTLEEWRGYEYSVDISFYGDNSFGSPTGRSVGIGWVAELLARLKHRYITKTTAQVNVTLDSSPNSFPLDQSLYFDFSHDTNIMSVLTALGLTQFRTFLPSAELVPHELIVSHMEPFAARLDIELIESPHPIQSDPALGFATGGRTTYIHFLLNQRTIPLHASYSKCADRLDGWCELNDFLSAAESLLEISEYEYACFGDYEVTPYGKVKNGVPLKNEK